MFVFHKSNGEIAYTIQGDELPATLRQNDLSVLEGTKIDDDLHMHYVENGEVRRKPDPPGDWAVWDTETKTWVDPRTSAEQNAQLLADLKARRNVAVESGTVINGTAMPTDPVSREMITGAAVSAMLDDTYTANWKMPDGSFVLLSASEIIGIASAIRAHVQACFDNESSIVAAIEAGEPYDIETGWP